MGGRNAELNQLSVEDARVIRPLQRPRRRAAFTLVEMAIAVGVMVFLVAMIVTAATALIERSERQQTENAITLLETALQEWELVADRKLRRGDGRTYDLQADREFVLVTTELLAVIRKQPHVEKILARIDPDLIYTYDGGSPPGWLPPDKTSELQEFAGSVTVVDAWGQPIYATHPGEPAAEYSGSSSGGTPPPPLHVDADGTERTTNEYYYGVARSRRVCFISAGPDERFGLPWEFPELSGEAMEDAIFEAKKDNIYSYQPVDPHEG